MKQAFKLLFRENVASWLRARGFILVLVAALVPAGLTAAWAYTHPLDVAVTDISWDVDEPAHGDLVNFTVTVENRLERTVGPFEVLVRVGFFEEVPGQDSLRLTTREGEQETFTIDGLGPHETTQVNLEWEAVGGVFLVLADVDPDDELMENEKHNNHRFKQVQVDHPELRPDLPEPDPRGNETDDNATTSAVAALRITDLTFTPTDAFEGDSLTATFRVSNEGPDDVENVTLRMALFRITRSGQVEEVMDEQQPTLSLPNGSVEERSLTVEEAPRGHFAAQGILLPPEGVEGTAPNDEVVARVFTVERQMLYEEPEEKLTAKTFYRTLVLDLIHLKVLIPLIALVYAAGVLSDEHRKNTIPYLFTRPVPRWALPAIRFGVSFVVAGVAITLGVLAVNAILLGQPGAEAEFLYWPLGRTLGALFVYGAVFTLLGVVTERPYLWGLLYVLGVEFLIFVGRNVLFFNDREFFQAWSELLSLNHWFLQVFSGWDASLVEAWKVPFGLSAPVFAGIGLAVIGVGALVGSSVLIQKRDFDV